MKTPRFDISDTVYYRTLFRRGTILEIINLEDREDIAAQGFRYYILIGQDVWSVPEGRLLLEKKACKIKASRTTKTPNLPYKSSGSFPKGSDGGAAQGPRRKFLAASKSSVDPLAIRNS